MSYTSAEPDDEIVAVRTVLGAVMPVVGLATSANGQDAVGAVGFKSSS
jgi:hypothetical protein